MSKDFNLTDNDSIVAAAAAEYKRIEAGDKRHATLTTDATLRIAALHGVFVRNEDRRADGEGENEQTTQNAFAQAAGGAAGTITKGRTVAAYVLGIYSDAGNQRQAASEIGRSVVDSDGVDAWCDMVRGGFAEAAERLECAPTLTAIYNALKRNVKPTVDPFDQWVAQTTIALGKDVTVGRMVAFLEGLLEEKLQNVA
jgi:hypothetical protein